MLLTPHTKDNYIISERRVFGMDVLPIPFEKSEQNPGKFLLVQKKLRVFRRTVLSTWDEPCSDDQFDVLKVCLDQYYQNQLNCTLPWTKSKSGSNGHKRRQCTKPEDLNKFKRKANTLYKLKQANLFKELNCQMPCTTTEYALEDWWESYHECDSVGCNEDVLGIVLAAYDSNVYRSKDIWLYNYSNFIADFGGYLGLLLGASAFSGYEWMKTGVKKIKRKYIDTSSHSH